MDKREYSVTILVIGLSVLFAVASFALFMSKGRSKFWTAKKMKLGAMILGLTTLAVSQKACITCYEPPPQNFIYIRFNNDTINLNDSTVINGTIDHPLGNIYSYKLQNDSIDSVKQTDDILPIDGVFDEDYEEFEIKINTSLLQGNYTLDFFDVKKEEIDSTLYPLNTYKIFIKNNK